MSSKEVRKRYRETHKDKINEYMKKYYSENKEYFKNYYEKNREQHKEKMKEWNRIHRYDKKNWHRQLKIEGMEQIAKFHNTELKCWRCGENRPWVLTIGHPNGDGYKDRETYGVGHNFYKAIISGECSCEFLRIECMNCNSCMEWYGEYPDEMTEESFKHSELQVRKTYK